MKDALSLAMKFHDTYETLAPSFGYETREDTKQFDPSTPNGKLMIAVCNQIMVENAIIPKKTLSWWSALTDINPQDLFPRIQQYLHS